MITTVPPLLELRQVSKSYGRAQANNRIDLDVRSGEILAVLGENGAGKSTLMAILAGVLQPDAGEILWRGQPVRLSGPDAARRLGIGMVFQHFTLFESLTVAENLALGGARGSRVELASGIARLAAQYGVAVDPARSVHTLSVGERQRVEILRCLLEQPQLLILDEPTAVLAPAEVEALFATIRRLAAEGRAVLFISHKLEEVRRLAHRAVILRGGRKVGECDPRRESAAALARLMVGTELPAPATAASGARGPERLRLSALSLPAREGAVVALERIDLIVCAGEILGIAGVAGNGQSELLAAINGERLSTPPASIRIDGVPAGLLGPAQRRRLGLAVIPEERVGRGAVAELSLAENALLTAERGIVDHGWVRRDRARTYARTVIERFQVVARDENAEAGSLSGGNLQKFILGREILRAPKVLVAAHPTRGVDVSAAAAIESALLALRAQGTALLIVSEDLDELLALADRVAVLSRGRLSPVLSSAAADRGTIGEWMSGLLPPINAPDAA
jgi:simple sugar transport system ATP-binding protein